MKRARPRAPKIPIQKFELACGARLVVSRRAGSPVTAIRAHVRGGHSLDERGFEGTAYLAGDLADQGTRLRSEEDIAGLLEPAGGQLGGDANGLAGTIASRDWKLLLQLFCESLTGPTYPKAKLERQKARLTERLEVEQHDPRAQSARRFRELVYGTHWLGRASYGTKASLARIERKHIVAHQKRNWCGARTVIAVSGDVDPEAVRRTLDKDLRAFPRGVVLPSPSLEFPNLEARCGAFESDRQQVHVYLGHLGIRRSDPDYEALVVMDHILGTGPGFTSRITRRLRDELGLAYTVHAAISSSAGVLPGTFAAYIGTSPEHVETAIAGFLDEIRRIQREPVQRAELELAKNYLLGSLAMGFERATQRGAYLITAERNGFPPDYLDHLLERFAAVTVADVQRVAKAHLHPDRSCVVTGGPVSEKELRGILSRIGGGGSVKRGATRRKTAKRAARKSGRK